LKNLFFCSKEYGCSFSEIKICLNKTVLILLMLAAILYSCDDTILERKGERLLAFSNDTISFDTVFTNVGSVTNKLLVYNNSNKERTIQSIRLANTNSMFFKINVDGSFNPKGIYNEITIRPHDSLYIFISVRIDPNNSNQPIIVEDSIIFTYPESSQKVMLRAIGQNVILLKSHRFKSDTTLTDTKPYLVWGDLMVDSAKTLTINPGCKFYFHNNASIRVNGQLQALGTYEKPILMKGDRRDTVRFGTPFPYDNLWGQWGGIFLKASKLSHRISHVFMNGGTNGIVLINPDMSITPSLVIENSRIHNFSQSGLRVQNCNVDVSNTEISNTGSNSVYIKGGKNSFIHCTIANFFNNSKFSGLINTSREKIPAVLLMDLERCIPMESIFQNCIITGSYDDELSIATLFPEKYNASFESNYIRKKSPILTTYFKNTIWWNKNDTVFKSVYYNYLTNQYFDFKLDSVSKVRGVADKTIATKYTLDLLGNNRMIGNSPDLGAYQWQPSKK
jgi:hypothetical protein